MSLRERLRHHTRTTVERGRELARDPEVKAVAGDLAAGVLLESLARLAAAERPAGERLRARVRRISGTVFRAAVHVGGAHLEHHLQNVK